MLIYNEQTAQATMLIYNEQTAQTTMLIYIMNRNDALLKHLIRKATMPTKE